MLKLVGFTRTRATTPAGILCVYLENKVPNQCQCHNTSITQQTVDFCGPAHFGNHRSRRCTRRRENIKVSKYNINRM